MIHISVDATMESAQVLNDSDPKKEVTAMDTKMSETDGGMVS